MGFGIKLLSPPAVEPVTLDEFKNHARVLHTDEDAYIEGILIPSAREWCEKITGRAFVEQTLRLSLDGFPDCIEPLRPRLIEVDSLIYDAMDETATTLDADEYRVDTDSEPGRITPVYGTVWPYTLDVTGSVRLTYKAGYGDEREDVPAPIRMAVLLVAADWFLNRENAAAGQLSSPVAMTVDRLLSPFWTGMTYGDA